MWMIAVLLLVSFAFTFYSKIATTQRMNSVFSYLAIALWILAVLLAWNSFGESFAVLGFIFLFLAISDLIAIPILRRRLIPPCVRVKSLGLRRIFSIIALFLAPSCIAFYIFEVATGSLSRFGEIVLLGGMTVSLFIYSMLAAFEKIEICGNGVWQFGGLRPWEKYESFSWKWKTTDRVELRLVSKSWLGKSRSTRLMVPPEDREAVHQLLEANLPDLSVEMKTET